MKVSCRVLIFDELLGYAYSPGFKQFSIKSTFEPITTPLKWVLADAACKVSMIFFNIASGLWWEMQNGAKTLNFTQEFYFLRPQVFFIYFCRGGLPAPPGGSDEKKKKLKSPEL